MRGVRDFALGLVLKRVLGRADGRPPRAARARRRGGGDAARPRRRGAGAPAVATQPASSRAATPEGRPRGALVGLMLAALVAGVVLMLLFEEWYTRLAGVLALFTFVVSGVFAITGSGLIDADE